MTTHNIAIATATAHNSSAAADLNVTRVQHGGLQLAVGTVGGRPQTHGNPVAASGTQAALHGRLRQRGMTQGTRHRRRRMPLGTDHRIGTSGHHMKTGMEGSRSQVVDRHPHLLDRGVMVRMGVMSRLHQAGGAGATVAESMESMMMMRRRRRQVAMAPALYLAGRHQRRCPSPGGHRLEDTLTAYLRRSQRPRRI